MKYLKTILFSYLILHFTLYILHSPLAAAQTATGSADQLRDSVKQKVAEELAQIKKAVSKKAFLGTITSKSEAVLTINSYLNLSRSSVVSTDTLIKLINGGDGTVADLKTGANILIMGDVDSNGAMTAKKLLLIAAPPADKRLSYSGKITVSGGTLTLETAAKEKIVAKLLSDSYLTTFKAGKVTKIKTSDLKSGDVVTLITKPGTTPSVSDLFVFPAPPSPTPSPKP